MHPSQRPFGNEPLDTESGRGAPSAAIVHDSEPPADSSNEDFLFHLYRGSELLQDNRVHEAKEELERALRLQPRDAKGQDLIAVVYFRLGLYARAIHVYEQLRRRNDDDPALLLNLALCYLKTGQPELARRDLEHLLGLNPTHARAWGYLGVACERMGDLVQAERAFLQGGHAQMARRVAARRDATSADDARPSQEVRDAAGAAYQELDAGELSFALAEPTEHADAAAHSWHTHELGQVRGAASDRRETSPAELREGARYYEEHGAAVSVPQLAHQQSANRRPTLLAPAGAPPMHEYAPTEYAPVEPLRSPKQPSFERDASSLRQPVVSVPSPFGGTRVHGRLDFDPGPRRTLAPPSIIEGELEALAPSTPLGIGPKSASAEIMPAADSMLPSAAPAGADTPIASAVPAPPLSHAVHFPESGVLLHRSGVALVHTTSEVGFAARLEAIRAQQSGVDLAPLERHVKGKATGEAFGGVATPMVLASGNGQLVLAPRPGRKLTAFTVEGELCFVREDVLLGFGSSLSFENGRLSTGEGEHLPIVQLRGDGAVLLEPVCEMLTLSVEPDRSVHVRREVILGWFGRLVPRAIAPADAPCGQHGLVGFAGQGRVLVASV